MARTLTFKKIRVKNNFPRIQKQFGRSFTSRNNVAEIYAKFTRVKARSLMRKGPKKPNKKRGLYGNYQFYTQNAYQNRVAKYGRSDQGFWRKGLYSRPGHPPFYHVGKGEFGLRTIAYLPINPSQGTLRKAGVVTTPSGGRVIASYRVGPLYRESRMKKPVPELHEIGGTVALGKGAGTRYQARNGVYLRRRQKGTARYPERPYMKPASKKGVQEANKKMKKLSQLNPYRTIPA